MWMSFLILSSKCWVKVHLAPGVKGFQGENQHQLSSSTSRYSMDGKLVVVWFRAGHLVGNYIVFVAIHWFWAQIYGLVNVLIRYQPPQASTNEVIKNPKMVGFTMCIHPIYITYLEWSRYAHNSPPIFSGIQYIVIPISGCYPIPPTTSAWWFFNLPQWVVETWDHDSYSCFTKNK
jgi:hypothetical protein